jgi:hypothetical protein
MQTNKDIPHSDKNSLLPSGPGENNFSVPSDYFDSLPEKIADRIHSGSKQKQPIFLLRPAFAVSSLGIFSIAIVFFVFFFNKHDVASDDMLLSDNEVQHIVDNPELYDIDDEVVTEQYIASDLSGESITEESDLPEDEVKSYLEENIETQNIINEY